MRLRGVFMGLFLAVTNFALGQEPHLVVNYQGEANLVGADGRVSVSVELSKLPETSKHWRVALEAVDWTGKQLASKDFAAPSLASAGPVAWKFQIDEFGPLTVVAKLLDGNKTIETETLPLIRLVSVPELTHEQAMASSIGVNTHVDANWPLLKKLGIHWARDFSFIRMPHGSRPPRGKNNHNFMATYLDAAKAGIILLPCMQQTYQNQDGTGFLSPDIVAAGYKELANTFPKIPYWEVENEYDTGLRKRGYDTVDVWGPFLEAVHRGLEESDSRPKVVMNGRAGIFIDFTRELLESKFGDSFAVVNYHFYTGIVPPEIARNNLNTGIDNGHKELYYLDRLRMINDLAKEHQKEAWLTEIGYDVTYGPAVGATLQAVFLTRAYLTARWAGTDKIFWYFDRDVDKSRGIFGSCGLYDLKGRVRPSGAALTALSRQIATAKPLGRLDLGGNSDAWHLVFEKANGGYVIASWVVRKRVPVPTELTQLGGQVFDIYGNATSPQQLTPEVLYFQAEKLPPDWLPRLKTKLKSPALQLLHVGETAQIKVEGPPVSEVEWLDLPPGVRANGYQLTVAPDTVSQEAEVQLKLKGEGWQRLLYLTLVVAPSLGVQVAPYVGGQETEVHLTLEGGTQTQWQLSSQVPGVSIQPEAVQLRRGETTSIRIRVPEEVEGTIQITAKSSAGTTQVFSMVPRLLEVPQASFDRSDPFPVTWPDQGKLKGDLAFLGASQADAPQAKMVWSAEGICLQVKIPSVEMNPGSEYSFWDGTNIELFVATDPAAGKGWNVSSHQFFFVPLHSEQGWRMSAGEWKRRDNIKKTVFDDPRLKTQVSREQDGFTLTAFVPASALNVDQLKAGTDLALGVAVRCVEGSVNDSSSYWWPVDKGQLAEGVQTWGVARLVP